MIYLFIPRQVCDVRGAQSEQTIIYSRRPFYHILHQNQTTKQNRAKLRKQGSWTRLSAQCSSSSSGALGAVAVGLPLRVAGAAQLPVAVGPGRHALALPAARDARPVAHVRPRVQLAPILARVAALCSK